MGKTRKKKRAKRAAATAAPRAKTVPARLDERVDEPDEERDVAETRAAAVSLVDAGVATHHRLASVCGAHPEDMKGFLEGRVSLTWPLRRRLREALPELRAPKQYEPGG